MAYKYDIDELKNKCIFQLFDAKRTIENCYQVLDIAYRYDIHELKNKCISKLFDAKLTDEYCSQVLEMACK